MTSTAKMIAILDSTVVDAEHPWPGLMPFSEEAQTFFHGRDLEAAELLRLIKRETLAVLFGQSGLGKSSLLSAGLFPRLRAEDFLPVYIRLDVSEDAPQFAAQVKAALADNCTAHRVDTVLPSSDDTLWGYFHHRDTDLWSSRNRLLTPVLVFDQFEEIFTLGRHVETLEVPCRAFLEEIADLVENRMPTSLVARIEADPSVGDSLDFGKHAYKVVFSFREDYLPEFEGLRNLIRPIMLNRMRLTRMSGEQALGAILQAGGHFVSEGVAAQVVRFVAAPRAGRGDDDLARLEVEPALMSVVCRELNNVRLREGRQQITAELLQGGAQQRIIQNFYDSSLQDVDARVRTFVEDQLLTEAGYRDSCALEDALLLPGVTRAAIDLLISRRLLRLEERSGILRVELTHDVLTQVARESRDRRKQREVEQSRLEKAAQDRRNTRRLAMVGGTVFALVVAAAVTFAVLLKRANEERRHLIETQSFIALSRANSAFEQGVPAEPYAMLAEAIRLNPENQAAVTRAVTLLAQRKYAKLLGHTALKTPAEAAWYDKQNYAVFGSQATAWLGLPGFQANVLGVRASGNDYEDFGLADFVNSKERSDLSVIEFSAEAPTMAARSFGTSLPYQAEARVFPFLSGNHMLHLFDPRTRIPVGKPVQLNGHPISLAVSRGRTWVGAVAGDDIILASTDGVFRDRRKLSSLSIKGTASISFVTDSGAILVRDDEGAVFLRPAERSREGFAAQVRLVGAPGAARANPAGSAFAVAVRSDVQVFDGTTGATIGKKLSHPSTVRDLAFSPDGLYLATACLDKQARLWDLQTQTLAGPLMKHHGAVLSVRFGNDSQSLFTGAADGAARIWQPLRGELLAEPMIHPDPVAEVMPQPDGDHLIALTNGQELYLWRWRHPAQTARRIVGFASNPSDGTTALATSPDSRRAALGSVHGEVTLIVAGEARTESGWKIPAPEKGGATAVTSIQFSPDGNRLAVAWGSGDVGIFDATSGKPLGKTMDHPQAVRLVKFSPDGKMLATVSQDRAVRLWHVDQQRMAAFGISHKSVPIGLAFSSDGSQILSVERNRIRLWETNSSTPRGETELAADGMRLLLAEFSADGKEILAVASDRVLRLPLEKDGSGMPSLPKAAQSAQVLALRDYKAWSAGISPERRQVALGGLDGRVRMVDLPTLRFVGETMRHDDSVLGVSYASDGRSLLSWSRDRSIRVWDTTSGHAVSDALMADSEPTAAHFMEGDTTVVVGASSRGGYSQLIGRPTTGATPAWLPELLELVGGAHTDSSGNAERLRDRGRTIMSFATTLVRGDEGWRQWALRIIEAIGPGSPAADRKD